ncbi:hypothetical protein ACM26M_15220 [Kluyvera cryocrescens]|uniref:hypothetical protein n=1 Tax=Kluyvera cryocrescens TaxID=580 RepID=UPI0039F73050
MSDPSWLGFGGLVASALSALAAYLAIQQTIKQRRISNKVQLIIQNNTIPINVDNLLTPMPLSRMDEQFNIATSVINVGLGPAIKVEYEWDFDYEKALSDINVSKFNREEIITGDQYRNILEAKKYHYSYQKDNDVIKIGIFGLGSFRPFTHNTKYNDVSYILPCGVEKKETELKFPSIAAITLIQSILNKLENFSEAFEPVPGPTLIIRYEDVTGVKEERIYKSTISLGKIAGKLDTTQSEVTFYLNYSHQYTWTAIALEKIRERYAEWKKTILLSNNN